MAAEEESVMEGRWSSRQPEQETVRSSNSAQEAEGASK